MIWYLQILGEIFFSSFLVSTNREQKRYQATFLKFYVLPNLPASLSFVAKNVSASK